MTPALTRPELFTVPGIDNIGSLFTRLGRQLGKARPGSAPPASSGARSSGSAAQEADLQALVGKKLAAIDTRGDAGRMQARYLFIESALAWQFGESILLDPGLQQLVQSIEADFAAEEDLAQELDRMLRDLAGKRRS